MDINNNDAITFLTHQVRTSLTSMMGFVEMLYDSQLTPKEKLSCLSRLRTIIENTGSSLQNVEYLASLDKGRLELHSTEFSLEEELSNTFQFLKSLARKNDLQLTVSLSGLIPNVILSDPMRVRQLITQLVSLFIGRTERGTIDLNLSLSALEPAQLVFKVDATGENISEDCFNDICGPPNPGTAGANAHLKVPIAHGETAIGLALVKALCEALGGKITQVPSQLGRGSALSVSLDPGPLRLSNQTDEFKLPFQDDSRATRSIEVPNFTDKRFLVVEDDRDISELWVAMLKRTGARVEHASDGQQALQLATGQNFDMIFLDLQLPKLNGLEVAEKLRQISVRTPIIALTANSSLAAKQRCLNVGCNLFLTKPVSMESLYKIIPQMSA